MSLDQCKDTPWCPLSLSRHFTFVLAMSCLATDLMKPIVSSLCLFGICQELNGVGLVFHNILAFYHLWRFISSFIYQFSSVAQSCPTLCDPMNHSIPGLPVHHQLLEFTQSCVHWVSDAIQPSHPWSSPSPPAPNPSQHQGLFQWVNSSHEVAKTGASALA